MKGEVPPPMAGASGPPGRVGSLWRLKASVFARTDTHRHTHVPPPPGDSGAPLSFMQTPGKDDGPDRVWDSVDFGRKVPWDLGHSESALIHCGQVT